MRESMAGFTGRCPDVLPTKDKGGLQMPKGAYYLTVYGSPVQVGNKEYCVGTHGRRGRVPGKLRVDGFQEVPDGAHDFSTSVIVS